jgi:hypothetical protein
VAQLSRAHAVTIAATNGRYLANLKYRFIVIEARTVLINEAALVDKESHYASVFHINPQSRHPVANGIDLSLKGIHHRGTEGTKVGMGLNLASE